ncbi:MAG: hypothetical protein IKN78_11525 [Bacteroidales bacterium]|nr:hypothetical protein [Bacteroidales bacterium]
MSKNSPKLPKRQNEKSSNSLFCSDLIPRSSPSAIRRKNIKFNETYNYYFVFFLAVTAGHSSNVIKTCRGASQQSRRWSGECPKALYREDIGYIDIVWGENDPKTNRGFGLKHIVEKHGANINELGLSGENRPMPFPPTPPPPHTASSP